jgi:hypothetical protein
MSNNEISDAIAGVFVQRHAAVNSLVESLKDKIGKDVPNDVMISTLIHIAQEFSSFYRILEMESKMMLALQTEIEVVAQKAYNTTGNQEATEEVIEFLREELLKAINDTTNSWNQS